MARISKDKQRINEMMALLEKRINTWANQKTRWENEIKDIVAGRNRCYGFSSIENIARTINELDVKLEVLGALHYNFSEIINDEKLEEDE